VSVRNVNSSRKERKDGAKYAKKYSVFLLFATFAPSLRSLREIFQSLHTQSSNFVHVILTSPAPSGGGEKCTDDDRNTNQNSPLWGDLEGSKLLSVD
jgi:hypothetical protein